VKAPSEFIEMSPSEQDPEKVREPTPNWEDPFNSPSADVETVRVVPWEAL